MACRSAVAGGFARGFTLSPRLLLLPSEEEQLVGYRREKAIGRETTHVS